MEEVRAVRLKVQTFTGRVGREQNAQRVLHRVGIEPTLDFLAPGAAREAVDDLDAIFGTFATLNRLLEYHLQVALRALAILGEDEDAAIVLGVNATMYKAIVYSISAFLPAIAGALMFYKNGMIDPSIAFEYMLSLEGIVMLMLGGQGTVIGGALGAALYERLRSYLLTSPKLSNFHLVIAGGLLLVVVLFASGGLIGWLYQLWPGSKDVIE